jgi:hypothetical protein
METKKPILDQAREFSEGVHSVYPDKWLAYNLSPSFNWDAAGLDENSMKSFVWELGKLGFVWQFITVRESLFPPLKQVVFPRLLTFYFLYDLAGRAALERRHI